MFPRVTPDPAAMALESGKKAEDSRIVTFLFRFLRKASP
jgi:hypothetical protein